MSEYLLGFYEQYAANQMETSKVAMQSPGVDLWLEHFSVEAGFSWPGWNRKYKINKCPCDFTWPWSTNFNREVLTLPGF